MSLEPTILAIPAGRYALGISGGADSVALAILASRTANVEITLAHLNHQLRGTESDEDERFVRELAISLNVPLISVRRNAMDSTQDDEPVNPSARYRAWRLGFFKSVIDAHGLDGVLLAHHADDQAETIFLRLLRGGGITSLGGMPVDRHVKGVRVVRPLLETSSGDLRLFLKSIRQPWREDSSNASDKYRRNIARAILRDDPELTGLLCALGKVAKQSTAALEQIAPRLEDRFECSAFADIPRIAARHAVRRWLVAHGAPADDVSPAVCERLIRQATDFSSPLRQHYPGRLLVRRRKSHLDIVETPHAP